jgi:hypothetical protein
MDPKTVSDLFTAALDDMARNVIPQLKADVAVSVISGWDLFRRVKSALEPLCNVEIEMDGDGSRISRGDRMLRNRRIRDGIRDDSGRGGEILFSKEGGDDSVAVAAWYRAPMVKVRPVNASMEESDGLRIVFSVGVVTLDKNGALCVVDYAPSSLLRDETAKLGAKIVDLLTGVVSVKWPAGDPDQCIVVCNPKM